jgi:hypothetical protein
MHQRTKALIAIVMASLGAAVFAGPAAAKDDLGVVPGKSINGISLGDTTKEVHKSKPLGLKKPTSSLKFQAPAVGKVLSETYIGGAFGNTLVVNYLIPKKKKGKKKKDPKVVFVSTGAGYWAIFGTGILYANGSGSSPEDVGKVYPCSFYTKYEGPRNYVGVEASDAQYCELIQAQDSYFYFTFNNGYTTGAEHGPAILAGFSLSKVQIP